MKLTAMNAVATYNASLVQVDEEQIMHNLQDQLTELLVKASFQDVCKANKIISDAIGEDIRIIDFLKEALQEAQDDNFIEQECQLIADVKALIAHSLDIRTARRLATSITGYFENQIISLAKREQHEDNYSTATQEL